LAAGARGAEICAVWHRILASTAVPIRIYFRTREGLETPDATISILPFLYEMIGRQRRVAKRQGITMNANVLRSEEHGSIHIKSSDPAEPPAIRFNFLSTEHDRAGIVAVIRKGRELMATSPLKESPARRSRPGSSCRATMNCLTGSATTPRTTYHPSAPARMGSDPMAVVNSELACTASKACAWLMLDHADLDQRQYQRAGHLIGEKCAEMVLAQAASRKAAA